MRDSYKDARRRWQEARRQQLLQQRHNEEGRLQQQRDEDYYYQQQGEAKPLVPLGPTWDDNTPLVPAKLESKVALPVKEEAEQPEKSAAASGNVRRRVAGWQQGQRFFHRLRRRLYSEWLGLTDAPWNWDKKGWRRYVLVSHVLFFLARMVMMAAPSVFSPIWWLQVPILFITFLGALPGIILWWVLF